MKKINIILSFCLIICSVFAFAGCSSNDVDSAKVTALMDKGEAYVEKSLENDNKIIDLLSGQTQEDYEILYGEDALNKTMVLLNNGQKNEYKRFDTSWTQKNYKDAGLEDDWGENYFTISVYADGHGNYKFLHTECEYYETNTTGVPDEISKHYVTYSQFGAHTYRISYDSETMTYVVERSSYNKFSDFFGGTDWGWGSYDFDRHLFSNPRNINSYLLALSLNANDLTETKTKYYLTQVDEDEYEFTIALYSEIHTLIDGSSDSDEEIEYSLGVLSFTIKGGLITKFVSCGYNGSDGFAASSIYELSLSERRVYSYSYSNDDIVFDTTDYTVAE